MREIVVDGITIKLKKHNFSKQLTLKVRYGQASVTLPKRTPYRTAETFARSKINWIKKQLSNSSELRNPTNDERDSAKERAKLLADKWSDQIGVNYQKITVRNQTTRWGSCSSQATLSFNWRFIYLPLQLQEYLIIHELAHIKHPNHSEEFWQLVSSCSPNYRQLRRKLKQIDFAELEG